MITSSQIISDSPQADGRRYITEQHIDNLKGELRFMYLGAADTNASVVMSARVVQYNETEIVYTFTVTDENGATSNL